MTSRPWEGPSRGVNRCPHCQSSLPPTASVCGACGFVVTPRRSLSALSAPASAPRPSHEATSDEPKEDATHPEGGHGQGKSSRRLAWLVTTALAAAALAAGAWAADRSSHEQQQRAAAQRASAASDCVPALTAAGDAARSNALVLDQVIELTLRGQLTDAAADQAATQVTHARDGATAALQVCGSTGRAPQECRTSAGALREVLAAQADAAAGVAQMSRARKDPAKVQVLATSVSADKDRATAAAGRASSELCVRAAGLPSPVSS